MYLGKVVGNVVSTSKDESLIGQKLLIIKKLDAQLNVTDDIEVAVDVTGAGEGETVLLVKGSTTKVLYADKGMPVDCAIVGIVDSIEMNG